MRWVARREQAAPFLHMRGSPEEGKNHFSAGFANGYSIGGISRPDASENVRTYKRRKKMVGMSSDSVYERHHLDGPVDKLAERTVKEPESSPCNHVSENDSTIDSNQLSRTFILRLMYHLLENGDGGIKRCIQDAFVTAESDSYNRQGYEPSSPTACKLKGGTFDTNSSFMCNGGGFTESSTITERCQHAFLNILLSENFTRLCKLLFENFQGTKAGNLFGLSLIDRRMREGAYEKMPLLFSSDIQQGSVLHGMRSGPGYHVVSYGKSGASLSWYLARCVVVSWFLSHSSVVMLFLISKIGDSSFVLLEVAATDPLLLCFLFLLEISHELVVLVIYPSTFSQLCKELQQIGSDLVSLSKSLQDVSNQCFVGQIGGLAHCPPKDVKHEFSYQKSDSHGKPKQTEACAGNQVLACRHCGATADTRDCLVCDSCEEIYHVFCIKPAISDIPPSWYCGSCTANGFGTESPHEDCVVCEKISAPRVQLKRTQGTSRPIDEDNLNYLEETSTSEQMHRSSGSECKICGIEVEDGGNKIKICEHDSCPYKYFHVRCLTKKQLKSHGPRWYCPSCLCRTCLADKDDNEIILCDSCDNAYHIYCLTPPLSSIPQGKWFCRQCQLKLLMIHKAKNAYVELDSRRKSGRYSKKGRGGMDVLLSAALKCEDGSLASNKKKT